MIEKIVNPLLLKEPTYKSPIALSILNTVGALGPRTREREAEVLLADARGGEDRGDDLGRREVLKDTAVLPEEKPLDARDNHRTKDRPRAADLELGKARQDAVSMSHAVAGAPCELHAPADDFLRVTSPER